MPGQHPGAAQEPAQDKQLSRNPPSVQASPTPPRASRSNRYHRPLSARLRTRSCSPAGGTTATKEGDGTPHASSRSTVAHTPASSSASTAAPTTARAPKPPATSSSLPEPPRTRSLGTEAPQRSRTAAATTRSLNTPPSNNAARRHSWQQHQHEEGQYPSHSPHQSRDGFQQDADIAAAPSLHSPAQGQRLRSSHTGSIEDLRTRIPASGPRLSSSRSPSVTSNRTLYQQQHHEHQHQQRLRRSSGDETVASVLRTPSPNARLRPRPPSATSSGRSRPSSRDRAYSRPSSQEQVASFACSLPTSRPSSNDRPAGTTASSPTGSTTYYTATGAHTHLRAPSSRRSMRPPSATRPASREHAITDPRLASNNTSPSATAASRQSAAFLAPPPSAQQGNGTALLAGAGDHLHRSSSDAPSSPYIRRRRSSLSPSSRASTAASSRSTPAPCTSTHGSTSTTMTSISPFPAPAQHHPHHHSHALHRGRPRPSSEGFTPAPTAVVEAFDAERPSAPSPTDSGERRRSPHRLNTSASTTTPPRRSSLGKVMATPQTGLELTDVVESDTSFEGRDNSDAQSQQTGCGDLEQQGAEEDELEEEDEGEEEDDDWLPSSYFTAPHVDTSQLRMRSEELTGHKQQLSPLQMSMLFSPHQTPGSSESVADTHTVLLQLAGSVRHDALRQATVDVCERALPLVLRAQGDDGQQQPLSFAWKRCAPEITLSQVSSQQECIGDAVQHVGLPLPFTASAAPMHVRITSHDDMTVLACECLRCDLDFWSLAAVATCVLRRYFSYIQPVPAPGPSSSSSLSSAPSHHRNQHYTPHPPTPPTTAPPAGDSAHLKPPTPSGRGRRFSGAHAHAREDRTTPSPQPPTHQQSVESEDEGARRLSGSGANASAEERQQQRRSTHETRTGEPARPQGRPRSIGDGEFNRPSSRSSNADGSTNAQEGSGAPQAPRPPPARAPRTPTTGRRWSHRRTPSGASVSSTTAMEADNRNSGSYGGGDGGDGGGVVAGAHGNTLLPFHALAPALAAQADPIHHQLVQRQWQQLVHPRSRPLPVPSPRFFLDTRSRRSGACRSFRISRSSMTMFTALLILPDGCELPERDVRRVACLAMFSVAAAFLTQQDEFVFAVETDARRASVPANTLGPLSQAVPLRVKLADARSFMDVFVQIATQMTFMSRNATVPCLGEDGRPLMHNAPVVCRYLCKSSVAAVALNHRRVHPDLHYSGNTNIAVPGTDCVVSPLYLPFLLSPTSRTSRSTRLPQLELTFWERPEPRDNNSNEGRQSGNAGGIACSEEEEEEEDEPRVNVSAICTGPSQKECVRLLAKLDALLHCVLREVSSEAYVRLAKLNARMRKVAS